MTTITVTTADGGKTDSYTITVVASAQGVLPVKTPTDPSGSYTSRLTGDSKDEGGWIKSPDSFVSVEMQVPGAIRLQDVLQDMADADGLTVTCGAYPGKFTIGSSAFTGTDRADYQSILYSAVPDRVTAVSQYAADTNTTYPITAQLILTAKDGRTATISVRLEYRNAIIAW